MTALPVLYSFRRCPYAMRARLALAASGQPCELREVVLNNKPQGLLQASAKGTVPVLVLPSGQVLDQSLDIMVWTLEWRDPLGWLAPSQGDLPQMRALIHECDGAFKASLDRYKYPSRYPEHSAHLERECAGSWLSGLEVRLTPAPFLFGQHAALADMAIAPFVRQFAAVDPLWWEAQPWPHLHRWLKEWQEGTLFHQIMPKFSAWVDGTRGINFPFHPSMDGRPPAPAMPPNVALQPDR